MGQVAALPGGFNEELLILEKGRDGKSFELHTDVHDRRSLYKAIRRAYAWAVLVVTLSGVMTFIPSAVSISAPMV